MFPVFPFFSDAGGQITYPRYPVAGISSPATSFYIFLSFVPLFCILDNAIRSVFKVINSLCCLSYRRIQFCMALESLRSPGSKGTFLNSWLSSIISLHLPSWTKTSYPFEILKSHVPWLDFTASRQPLSMCLFLDSSYPPRSQCYLWCVLGLALCAQHQLVLLFSSPSWDPLDTVCGFSLMMSGIFSHSLHCFSWLSAPSSLCWGLFFLNVPWIFLVIRYCLGQVKCWVGGKRRLSRGGQGSSGDDRSWR